MTYEEVLKNAIPGGCEIRQEKGGDLNYLAILNKDWPLFKEIDDTDVYKKSVIVLIQLGIRYCEELTKKEYLEYNLL